MEGKSWSALSVPLQGRGRRNEQQSVCPADHLLGGLPAGRRDGLAQEALHLPGVRDAADRQSLQPGQGQPAVRDLQQEQAPLSRGRLRQALGAETESG